MDIKTVILSLAMLMVFASGQQLDSLFNRSSAFSRFESSRRATGCNRFQIILGICRTSTSARTQDGSGDARQRTVTTPRTNTATPRPPTATTQRNFFNQQFSHTVGRQPPRQPSRTTTRRPPSFAPRRSSGTATRQPFAFFTPSQPSRDATTRRPPSFAPRRPSGTATRQPFAFFTPSQPSRDATTRRPPSFASRQTSGTDSRQPSNFVRRRPFESTGRQPSSVVSQQPPLTTTRRPGNANIQPNSGQNEVNAQSRLNERFAREFIERDHEMIPNLLQLVFHVCVGGCDGCLNLAEPANTGLITTYPTVRRFCQTRLISLSLADCIVFMATKAVEIGMEKSGGITSAKVAFRPGRRTCPDPDNYRRTFVFAGGDRLDGLDFLQREFRLTRREAVALMGAHSCGRARSENSGFFGHWDNTETTLDNEYYKSLLNSTFTIRRIGSSSQWESPEDNLMMLHSDMSLVKSYGLRSDGLPTCFPSTQCPQSNDAATVSFFARNEVAWAREFVTGFVKMCDHR